MGAATAASSAAGFAATPALARAAEVSTANVREKLEGEGYRNTCDFFFGQSTCWGAKAQQPSVQPALHCVEGSAAGLPEPAEVRAAQLTAWAVSGDGSFS